MTVEELMDTMRRETWEAPSRVAFRNLGIPGENISVKYHDNEGFVPNSYSWSRGGVSLAEHEARKQLQYWLDSQTESKDTSRYVFENGWSMKREFALVIINNDLGRFAQGKWVLRNEKNEAVDLDRYRNDLIERYPALGAVVQEPSN